MFFLVKEMLSSSANICHSFHTPGLSLTEGKKLSSYFHFTEPENLKNKTLLEKADLDPAIDFLDSLEHDIPKGREEGTSPRQADGCGAVVPAFALHRH